MKARFRWADRQDITVKTRETKKKLLTREDKIKAAREAIKFLESLEAEGSQAEKEGDDLL